MPYSRRCHSRLPEDGNRQGGYKSTGINRRPGKAGGVKLVNNTEDAYQEAKNILGMSIKGLPVNQVLVSEAVDIAAEYYVSYTIDRNTRSAF